MKPTVTISLEEYNRLLEAEKRDYPHTAIVMCYDVRSNDGRNKFYYSESQAIIAIARDIEYYSKQANMMYNWYQDLKYKVKSSPKIFGYHLVKSKTL